MKIVDGVLLAEGMSDRVRVLEVFLQVLQEVDCMGWSYI